MRLRMAICPVLLACGAAGLLLAGCSDEGSSGGNGGSGGDPNQPTVAYVTNGIADFWVIAQKGAEDAAEEFDCNVLVRMPPEGVASQKRMVEDLLTRSVDGIAISPIDPANQGDLLDQISELTNLITHDSDAPDSDRLCYVGMDNYTAGRMCGELVKEALPDGGSIIIFVGRIEQDNARLRRQGLIDELLDRSVDPTRFDPPGDVLEGSRYTILDTRTDNFNMSAAKEQPEDAIARYPDLDCMVGLFAYNPPKILQALAGADKLGEIQVIGFDEDADTLRAIQDGTCYGTIVQDPYSYGYESVRILAALARGDESVLPEDGFLSIPARKIVQDNVDAFWDDLREKTGEGSSRGAEEEEAEETEAS